MSDFKYPVGTLIYNQRSYGMAGDTPQYVVTHCNRDRHGKSVYDLKDYKGSHRHTDIMEVTIDGYFTTLPYRVKLDDRLFEL